MSRQPYLFTLFCLLGLQASLATASDPVFSLEPQGALPTKVIPGSSTVAKYTVHNEVPYTLEANGLSYQGTHATPATVTQNTSTTNTPTTCTDPFTLLPGGSCTLEIMISGVAVDGPKVCNTKYSPSYCAIPTSTNLLNVSLVTADHNLSIAMGRSFLSGQPILAQSIHGGSWSMVTSGIPSVTGTLQSGSCSGNFCVSAGADTVVQTTDAGVTWATPSIPSLPSSFEFSATSCNGTWCILAGEDATGAGPPLLVQTTDAGSTWTQPSVTGGYPTSGLFQGVSCNGSVCIAAGQDNSGADPFLIQSTDGGLTWAVQSVTGVSFQGIFNSASCNSSLCVAVGKNQSTNAPFLAQRIQGGSWLVQTITGLPTSGEFSSVSCSENICVAAGDDGANPLVVQSTNGGTLWNVQTVFSTSGTATSVSCSGKVCVISAGPSLAQTTNAGTTWTVLPSIPSVLDFTGVSCSGFVCNAAGFGLEGGILEPVVAQSISGGTWSLVNIDGVPSIAEFLGVSTSAF